MSDSNKSGSEKYLEILIANVNASCLIDTGSGQLVQVNVAEHTTDDQRQCTT